MKPTAVIYGSTGDATKQVAYKIAEQIKGSVVYDVATIQLATLEKYTNLILGTSTWGIGDLQDDWEGFLPQLEKANLEGKTIALFGLGDAASYPDTFVDGIGILYEVVSKKGCKLIGSVSVSGYNYDASRAEVGGELVGLALDEDNEFSLTDTRIAAWVADILPAL